MSEPSPVVLRDVGKRLQQVDRRHDEVVEVQRVALTQTLLVERVALGVRLLDEVRGPTGERLLVDELVLEVADVGGDAARREALRVEVEVADDQPHQSFGVGLVVDREAGVEPQVAGFAAQDPHASGVERRHPHRPSPATDQRRNPLLHLAGGLVGERDREHLAGLHLASGEQVGHAVGEDARLARARAGNDQQRAALVLDGVSLGWVQAVEQRRDGVVAALLCGVVRGGIGPRQPKVVEERGHAVRVRPPTDDLALARRVPRMTE